MQGVKTTEIPLSWDALCSVYDEAIGKVATSQKQGDIEKDEPEKTETLENLDGFEEITPVEEEPAEEKPVRRRRRTRAE